jgi:hypothetical protein
MSVWMQPVSAAESPLRNDSSYPTSCSAKLGPFELLTVHIRLKLLKNWRAREESNP